MGAIEDGQESFIVSRDGQATDISALETLRSVEPVSEVATGTPPQIMGVAAANRFFDTLEQAEQTNAALAARRLRAYRALAKDKGFAGRQRPLYLTEE